MTGLSGWKDIAVYLKRGIRTVQRWEREEKLPVHRLQHEKLGSVYAYAEELDAWWASRGTQLDLDASAPAASLAVLPFADLSPQGDQQYFCDGLAEELINALSRLSNLRVASRTAAFRFRSPGFDLREAGRQLRAAHLLEGSVRRSGDRLRITAQLVGVEDGFHLWSETYDRRLGDIFAVQEEIARRVAHELDVRLSPPPPGAMRTAPTSVLEAYDCYLRGRQHYYQYGPSDMDRAAELFTRAIEADPAYPQAHAGLADCWSYRYLYVDRSPESLARAEAASRRAVEMDPACAQAQASRALALSLSRRDEEAEAAFRRAAELDPNLFEAFYFHARHAFVMGRKEQAIELYREAERVRPEDYQSPLLAAQCSDDLGQPEAAREARLRGIERAGQHLKHNPEDVRAVYMAANGMAALGQIARASEWASRAMMLRPRDPMLLYNVGCVYALLNLSEPALDVLEQAVRFGLRQKGWFLHDSNLDSLRAEARFQRILDSLED